jgi:hypothetical protein
MRCLCGLRFLKLKRGQPNADRDFKKSQPCQSFVFTVAGADCYRGIVPAKSKSRCGALQFGKIVEARARRFTVALSRYDAPLVEAAAGAK